MKNILMVCLGNICRSPIAEGILKSKTKHLDIHIDSAGTAAYHVGEKPDKRSIDIAKMNNIDLCYQRARQFTINDFDLFDKIYVMDTNNYANVISLARNDNDKLKVDLILNELYPKSFQSVPDPYYGGEDGFQNVFNMLNKACEKIINRIG